MTWRGIKLGFEIFTDKIVKQVENGKNYKTELNDIKTLPFEEKYNYISEKLLSGFLSQIYMDKSTVLHSVPRSMRTTDPCCKWL